MGRAVARPRTNPALEIQQAEQVFNLVLAGKSYRAIAEEIGVSLATVHRRLEKYKAEVVTSRAEELREIQLARVEAGIAANWKGYLAGDKDATNSMLRLFERQARLMGLDSAQAYTVKTEQVNHQSEASAILKRMLAAKATGQVLEGEIVRRAIEG